MLCIAETKEQPWKNGGGSTRLLAEGLGWRISLATVSHSGPFSVFEGWRRHSVVVAGGGFRLLSASGALELTTHKVVDYDGGVERACVVDSEHSTVFNVMCDSRIAGANVYKAHEVQLDAQGTFAILPVQCGALCLAKAGTESTHVPSGAFMVVNAPADSFTCSAVDGSASGGAYLLVAQINQKATTN